MDHQTNKRKIDVEDKSKHKKKHESRFPLLELPYNVVTLVLANLGTDLWRIGEVSKALLAQLRDNTKLWTNVTLDRYGAVDLLTSTNYPINKIKSLTVDVRERIEDDNIDALDLNAFTGLERVELITIQGECSTHSELNINCPNLTSLAVDGIGIWQIKSATKLPKLTNLNIAVEVTTISITNLLNKIPATTLTKLELTPDYDYNEDIDAHISLITPSLLLKLNKFVNLTHFTVQSDAIKLFALRHLPRHNIEFISVTSNNGNMAPHEYLKECDTKQIVFPKLKHFELYNYSIVAFEVRDLINYWAPNLEIFLGKWGGTWISNDMPTPFYANIADHPILKEGYVYRDRCSVLASKLSIVELIEIDENKWAHLHPYAAATEVAMVADRRIQGPVAGVQVWDVKGNVHSTYDIPAKYFYGGSVDKHAKIFAC